MAAEKHAVFNPYQVRQARAWAQAIVWNLGKGGWLPAEMTAKLKADCSIEFRYEGGLVVRVALQDYGTSFEQWYPQFLGYRYGGGAEWARVPYGAWSHLAPNYGAARLGHSVNGDWESLRVKNPPRVVLDSQFGMPFPKGWVDVEVDDRYQGQSLYGTCGYYEGQVGPLSFDYSASEPRDARITFKLSDGSGPEVTFSTGEGRQINPEEFRAKLDPEGTNEELRNLLVVEQD